MLIFSCRQKALVDKNMSGFLDCPHCVTRDLKRAVNNIYFSISVYQFNLILYKQNKCHTKKNWLGKQRVSKNKGVEVGLEYWLNKRHVFLSPGLSST